MLFALEGGGSGYHLYELRYDPVTTSADLFVDGVERVSGFTGMLTGITRVAFGAGQETRTGHGNYNLVRFEIATPVCVAPPSGMVSWWDGDSVSGTTAFDIQGGNNGTLVNGVTTAPGVVGDAFSFDGVNDFVEIPDSASLRPATEITIDAWVRVDSVPDGASVHIVDRHSSEGGKPFEGYLLWAAGSGFGSSLWTANNGQVTVRGGPTNIVGTFHHVAMTYDGATVRLYVDGVQVNSASAMGSITYAGTLNLNLGRNQQPSIFSRRFHGLLDEVEIYDRALSASEIQAIFLAGSAGKCKGGPPVAGDDSYATDEDTALTVAAPGVLGNDTDPDGDTLTAALVSGPAHGTLILNANGSFTYTPTGNYNGPDSFTYNANDGTADSNVATVTITVNPVNDPPVANSQSITTPEDTPITVTLSATDPDSGALILSIVSGPAHGTLASNGALVYTPSLNYNGPDSFTFKASDGSLDSNIATVTITVNPVNDPPVAVNDSYSTPEDTALTVALPGVLSNDTDADANPLTAILVAGPTQGALILNANGSFTYTPNPSFFGADSFTYKANDGALDSNIATVTITVTPGLAGRMEGDGHIDQNGQRHRFEFHVRERANGEERGRLHYRVRPVRPGRNHDDDNGHGPVNRFVSTQIPAIAFSDDPTVTPGKKKSPNVDTVVFRGAGRWNGASGYTFEARAVDAGEPGRGRDLFMITVRDPSGNVVSTVTGMLTGGNIQSHRIRHP